MPHGRLVHGAASFQPPSPRGALIVGWRLLPGGGSQPPADAADSDRGYDGAGADFRRVPLWVPVAMALLEVGWLALAWPYLAEHYDLFDPDPGSSAAPAGYEPGDGLSGLVLVTYAGRVELLLLGALAVIGLARRLGARRWDLAAVTLLVAPLLIVGVQSYGARAAIGSTSSPSHGCASWPRRPAAAARHAAAEGVAPVRVALATGALGVHSVRLLRA